MVEIICFLFPAAFSVFALERLLAKKLNLRNFLMVFVTNTLIINLVGLFVMFCVTSAKTLSLTTQNGVSINLALVYLTITSVLSVICVLVERFYFYRLRIGVKDRNNADTENKDDHEA